MQTLHFSLFGKLKICDDHQTFIALEARRAQELLCYLLLYRNRLHEREKLATLMWCDAPAPQSKKYLRQALWKVQTAVNLANGADQAQILRIEHEHIGINPVASFWLDVAAFEEAFAAVHNMRGRDLNQAQIDRLKAAVQLYKGDLLEGWYQDWYVYERERYQNIYLAMLDKLLSYSEAYQQFETGITYGLQILGYDRARETTHQRLMGLYYAAGDRTTALHQYALCVAALQEELNVGPSERTIALYEQIRTDRLEPASPNLTAVPKPPAPQPVAKVVEASPLDQLQQLQQIQIALTKLQEQVGQLINSMQQTNNQRTVEPQS